MSEYDGSTKPDYRADYLYGEELLARREYLENDKRITDEQTYGTGDWEYECPEEAAELEELLSIDEDDKLIRDATFIRDDAFAEYARQLAEDIGAIDDDARWPATHIDWEAAANALKTDYIDATLFGIDYWYRP